MPDALRGKSARTPLTYYGGKQRVAEQLVALMPEHQLYLEPFAGGAAVLFAKPRVQRETLNDVDGAIVAFWRVLREHPDALARSIEATPYARAEWEACRAGLDDDVAGDVERARRLLVTIDQSYARVGKTWSPPSKLGDRPGRWQADTWARMPARLLAAADRLRGVAIEHADALDLIARWDLPGALIYCDPPYTGAERLRPRGSPAGGEHGYRHDDHPDLWPRLVDRLLAVEHAVVVLSGYPCDDARRLEIEGWRAVPIRARRVSQNMPGKAGGTAPETAWVNVDVDVEQQRLAVAG